MLAFVLLGTHARRGSGDYLSDGENKVVAVDDFVIRSPSERLAGLVRVQAADPLGVGGCVISKAASELLAGRVADPDDVTFFEFAGHGDDADGEQAAGARFESFPRAYVDDEVAARPRCQADPSLPRRCVVP